MKQSFIFKHQFKLDPRIIDESTDTLPDLVLSMRDIYRKYAVTGDISALPGAVRPLVQDPEDYDGEAPEFEELVDVSYNRTRLRDELRTRQQDTGQAAAERKPVAPEGASKKEPETVPPKPEESAANPADTPSD